MIDQQCLKLLAQSTVNIEDLPIMLVQFGRYNTSEVSVKRWSTGQWDMNTWLNKVERSTSWQTSLPSTPKQGTDGPCSVCDWPGSWVRELGHLDLYTKHPARPSSHLGYLLTKSYKERIWWQHILNLVRKPSARPWYKSGKNAIKMYFLSNFSSYAFLKIHTKYLPTHPNIQDLDQELYTWLILLVKNQQATTQLNYFD